MVSFKWYCFTALPKDVMNEAMRGGKAESNKSTTMLDSTMATAGGKSA